MAAPLVYISQQNSLRHVVATKKTIDIFNNSNRKRCRLWSTYYEKIDLQDSQKNRRTKKIHLLKNRLTKNTLTKKNCLQLTISDKFIVAGLWFSPATPVSSSKNCSEQSIDCKKKKQFSSGTTWTWTRSLQEWSMNSPEKSHCIFF
jgi:hypothetical protein